MKKDDIGVERFKVHSYHMDAKGRLNLTSIAGFMQEIAGEHAKLHNFGYNDMLKQGVMWVITRLKIIIHKYPHWSDELIAKTWVVNREKFFSRRDFEIFSDSGELLISAMTGWMLIDINTKRPQLVDNLKMDFTFLENKLAIDAELDKIEGLNFINSTKTYTVKYSDLDIIQHVNNTQYQRIILDTFSTGYRFSHHLKSFEINYLAEALIDDELEISTSRTNTKNEFKHQIIRKKDNKLICRAISFWEAD